MLNISVHELLTAAEGLFVKLSQQHEHLQWSWMDVRRYSLEVIESQENDIIRKLCNSAKLAGDYLKTMTKNQSYRAPWTARIAEAFFNLKKNLDHQKKVDDLTKLY